MFQTIDRFTGPYMLMFNGPPRSGKDTIAAALAKRLVDHVHPDLAVFTDSFARPMREMGMKMFGLSTMDQYNDYKDVPNPDFHGWTLRQWMIDFSEKYMKDRFGLDVWGRMIHRDHRQWMNVQPGILIFSDLGFAEEFLYCKQQTYPANVAIVQLSRPGTNWSLDSRGYVFDHDQPMNLMQLMNDATAEEAADAILRWMLHDLCWDLIAGR